MRSRKLITHIPLECLGADAQPATHLSFSTNRYTNVVEVHMAFDGEHDPDKHNLDLPKGASLQWLRSLGDSGNLHTLVNGIIDDEVLPGYGKYVLEFLHNGNKEVCL